MARRRAWYGLYRAISLVVCGALLLGPDLGLARPDRSSRVRPNIPAARPFVAPSINEARSSIEQAQSSTNDLQLAVGWNLIALPVQPTSTAPATLLASIAGKYRRVYA